MSPPKQRLTPTKPSLPNAFSHSSIPTSPSALSDDCDRVAPFKLDLRLVLDGFLKLRLEWDELVLSRSLGLAVKIIELESEIQLTVQHACFTQNCTEQAVELKDGYAWKQLCKSNELKSRLNDTLDEMTGIVERIQDVLDSLEALVQRSCRALGTRRVFESPMGSTWPLPRFCDHLIGLSAQYRTSLNFHEALYHVLASTDASSSEKQAALSYWACQPLMYDKDKLKDLLLAEMPDLFPGYTPRKASNHHR